MHKKFSFVRTFLLLLAITFALLGFLASTFVSNAVPFMLFVICSIILAIVGCLEMKNGHSPKESFITSTLILVISFIYWIF